MRPLVIIPTYLTEESDAAVTKRAIESCRETQRSGVEILVVDDGSPEKALVSLLEQSIPELDFEVVVKDSNTGFAQTVNVGMERALESGQDAVLFNADLEILTPNWVRTCKATTDDRGEKAAVIGGLLSYPHNGLIQHGGIYFSALTRTFDHLFQYAPENLPEALVKRVCPVTGAFQYIRHETLETVGIYDPKFFLGWEDVSYCIEVFLAKKRCVYNPNIRALHAESLFRGRPSPKVKEWQEKSLMYLILKHQNLNFADFVPNQ
jgi:GT2 family glycosyltransferase